MDVQKITQELRAKHWIDIIKECRSSGETIKSWCEEQGINLKITTTGSVKCGE